MIEPRSARGYHQRLNRPRSFLRSALMTRASRFAILPACGVSLVIPATAIAQARQATKQKQQARQKPADSAGQKSTNTEGIKVTNFSKAVFGKTPDGEEVNIYTLENANGMVVKLIDFGAAIQSLRFPDKDGKPLEMQLGYETLDEYHKFGSHFGAAVGRFANRIAGEIGRA